MSSASRHHPSSPRGCHKQQLSFLCFPFSFHSICGDRSTESVTFPQSTLQKFLKGHCIVVFQIMGAEQQRDVAFPGCLQHWYPRLALCGQSGAFRHHCSSDFARHVLAAKRIREPQRAFGIVTPLSIHEKTVMICAWRQLNAGAPNAIPVLVQMDWAFLPVRKVTH